MKKLILSVTAVAGFSMASFAQGVIYFDGSNNSSTSVSATTEGQVFVNGVLDTTQDINAELLYSSTSTGTFSPVVTLLLSSSNTNPTQSPTLGQVYSAAGDATFYPGQLLDNSGAGYIIPGIAPSTTAYFEVEGWLGQSSTFAGATGAKGVTAVFSESLASAVGTPNDIENMPALNLTTAVPEPSTLAMAGVGLASMLIFRRRK
jgi:hypothetical protein